jgi:protein O-mannosyl-transferase
MKSAKSALSIALITFLGVIIYYNSLHCSFHFDDFRFIVDNAAIKNIYDLLSIWNYYPCRFVTFLSLALNYHFQQLNVFGFHLFNLTIHLITALLVWWLTLLTLSTPIFREDKIARHANLTALFAGLVFVSHPVQTEAVTFIWQRTASMATMFYLASLCLYIKSRSTPQYPMLRRFYYIFSLITALLAMFTKETAITLPLMILLYEYFFLMNRDVSRSFWKRVTPFLLTLLIIPITMFLTKSTQSISAQEMQYAVNGTTKIAPLHYFLTETRVMLTYVRLAFLPINQNLDYDYPIYKNIFDLPVLGSILFLMAVLYSVKRLFAKYRLLSFSIIWFFVTLIPESGSYALGDVIVEHRLYLPLAGYSIFLVGGMFFLLGRDNIKMMIIALTVIITCNSILTYERNKIWKNDLTLWDDAVSKSPHKARPYNGRGLIYFQQGDFIDAMADLNKAVKINPDYAEAYNNRGLVYGSQNNFPEALANFNKAVKIDPADAQAYNNRGFIYASQGDFTQAIKEIKKAITLNPDFTDAYYNLGKIYNVQGRLPQAISEYDKAITINPDDENAYLNRGSAYYQRGETAQAIADYHKAIALDPAHADTYYDLGFIYYNQGNWAQAIFNFNKDLAINPKDTEAFKNRSLCYYRLKENEK